MFGYTHNNRIILDITHGSQQMTLIKYTGTKSPLE